MTKGRVPDELAPAAFHAAVAAHPLLACVAHRGPYAACATAVAPLLAGATPWHWTRIDLDAAPEIAAMFGIDGPAPWLLVMREQVVLYREPLSAKPPAETRALIDRAAGLDMAAVHDAVAARRRALDSLHMRRVCPTALRGPGPG